MHDKNDIYRSAISQWGLDAQILMVAEEATEMAHAALKYNRHPNSETTGNFAEEIADCELMIEQMRLLPSLNKLIDEMKIKKLKRLESKLFGDDSNGQ